MARKSTDFLTEVGLEPLSATELEYMNLIWEYPEGISSEEINTHFPNHALNTKRVIMYNITKKGYVKRVREGIHQRYFYKISSKDYDEVMRKHMFKKKYGETLENIIASFCGKKLSEGQISKLYSVIKEIKDGTDK